jgi:hypothetical protein
MTNPFPSDSGSISVGGTIITTLISNYGESGGEISNPSIKTMGRRINRTSKGIKSPYQVTFNFSAQDTTFGNTLSVGSWVDQVIFKVYEDNPSITITYGEGIIKSINYNHNADDLLKGNMIIEFNPYDNDGVDNRTVS